MTAHTDFAPPALRFSAVLLAGGRSSRMGQDKAWLPWPERPLWAVQLEKLRALQPAELLVSARPEQAIAGDDFQIIADAQPDCGPLAGISAALNTLRTDWLIVLAVDLPTMTPVYLAALLRRAAISGRGQIPHSPAGLEPLAAIYPQAAAPQAAAQLTTSDFSLQTWAHTLIDADFLETCPILPGEAALFANANAPADLGPLLDS